MEFKKHKNNEWIEKYQRLLHAQYPIKSGQHAFRLNLCSQQFHVLNVELLVVKFEERIAVVRMFR